MPIRSALGFVLALGQLERLVRSSPSRSSVSLISSPGSCESTAAITSSIPVTALPSTATIRSPPRGSAAHRRSPWPRRPRCPRRRRAVRDDVLDQGAESASRFRTSLTSGSRSGAADPEEGVLDLALGDQLLRDVARRVDRDGEADPDVALAVRLDLRVDADDLSRGVEQRAAELPGLIGASVWTTSEIVKPSGADLALQRRDDSGGHRAVEAERVADRRPPGRRRRAPTSRRASAAASSSAGASTFEHGDVGGRSWPTSSASRLSSSSPSLTSISSAPSTTCALVMMCPSSSITKPEPDARLSCGPDRAVRRAWEARQAPPPADSMNATPADERS